jgi:hypothetical protein
VLKDYDSKKFYHPTKANVVADALSRKSSDGETDPKVLMDQLAQHFSIVHIDEVMTGSPPIMTSFVVQPLRVDSIWQAQEDDRELQDLIIPNDAELRRDILDEAHQTQYTVHPGNNKMYRIWKRKFC